jgi:hypothetical protein
MSKPQVNLNIDGLMLIGLGVGVPLLGFIGYKIYGARESIAGAVDKVNPASANNFVNQGVESLGQAITGDENFTLGGWAFDWTHNTDGSQRPLAGMYIPGALPGFNFGLMALVDGASAVAPYVNPANPNNLVNQAVTGVVGEENVATAADKVFGLMDLLNPFNESDAYAKIIWGL